MESGATAVRSGVVTRAAAGMSGGARVVATQVAVGMEEDARAVATKVAAGAAATVAADWIRKGTRTV